mmetsp:Transcript_13645/g.42207  ORF Transcript_13645/g.42207 Transcript_13645/m.42207 type:complete len:156 (+) Transcript_13645:180-647(+)
MGQRQELRKQSLGPPLLGQLQGRPLGQLTEQLLPPPLEQLLGLLLWQLLEPLLGQRLVPRLGLLLKLLLWPLLGPPLGQRLVQLLGQQLEQLLGQLSEQLLERQRLLGSLPGEVLGHLPWRRQGQPMAWLPRPAPTLPPAWPPDCCRQAVPAPRP